VSSLRKDRIRTLLKGIETGDPAAVSMVNEAKYIQHNPQTQEGGEGWPRCSSGSLRCLHA
jgi:predicted SnoaL-like aldol condensation-catalyzing enzyme